MGRKRKPKPRYIGRRLPASSSTETPLPPSAHPILICTSGGSRLLTHLEPYNFRTVSQCQVECSPYGGLGNTVLISSSFDPLGVCSQTERYGSGRTIVFHLSSGRQISQINRSVPYCICGIPESTNGAGDSCFEFPMFALGSSVYEARTGKRVCSLGGQRRQKTSLWEWRCSRWMEEWGSSCGQLVVGGTVSVREPAILQFDVRSGRTEPVGRCLYDEAWRPPDLLPYSQWKVSSVDADAARRIIFAGCERCKHLDVWDGDGQRIKTVPLSDSLSCLKCVPNLNCLVVGLLSGNVEVVDLRRTAQSLRVIQRPKVVRPHVSGVPRQRRRIEHLDWIENSVFVCSSSQGKIATFDIMTGKWMNQIVSNCECVNVLHQSDPRCDHSTVDEEERVEFLLSFIEQVVCVVQQVQGAIMVHLPASLGQEGRLKKLQGKLSVKSQKLCALV